MNRIAFFLLLVLISGCSGVNQIPPPEISPEISQTKLNQHKIVSFNPNYKGSYFRLLPYLYNNSNNTFNQIQGDYYNIDLHIHSSVNIMPGYFREYGKYRELKNVLVVQIMMGYPSKFSLNSLPISVSSSKHGYFKRNELYDLQINHIQQEALYVKKLEIANEYDVLEKVRNDTITVTIGGQVFEFLNPEIELD
jgi:hypothetical protein